MFASFARPSINKLLCAGGLMLVGQAFSTAGHAQACVDPDGDGWGWNGSDSCLVTQAPVPNESASVDGLACVDEDGDGFGWNGFDTCLIGSQNQQSTIDSGSVDTGSGDSGAGNTGSSGPTLECIDIDGDGWGWNGVESCQVSGSAAAQNEGQSSTPSSPGNESVATPVVGNSGFDSRRDLVALHFDHAPDRDDGHAAVAALMVTDELQLNVQVVAGTYGVYSRDRYDSASEGLMASVWGSAWHNAHRDRAGSVAAAVNRWTSVLAAGGSVWVAEGGPADFTAAVVRTINANHSEFNTRQRIHVIQHSDWNEDHSLESDLAYAKANTNYVKIADGNDPNATADFRFESHNNVAFVSRAQSSRYASEWGVAFNYLSPNEKLDFSDAVELMHIVGIGTNQIRDVNDFGDYFF